MSQGRVRGDTGTVSSDVLPFHVLVSGDPGTPIEAFEQSAALRLAVVEQGAVRSLSDDWDAPGVYILLDRVDPDGNWGCYVGKAPAGIRARLRQHQSNRDHWYRAILIKRDTTHGFNSAHTAWLEGRIYDLLDAATSARLHNAQRPGDDTLAAYDLPMLESTVDPLSRLLRLIGHDTATAEDLASPATSPTRTNQKFNVSLKDLIDGGYLEGTESLVSTWATVPATAQLNPDGTVTFAGNVYDSPSGAAIAARGGSTNGWAMWAVETPTGKVRLATIRSKYLKDKEVSQASGGAQ